MHIVNKWPDNAFKVTAKTPLQPNQWYHVFVTYDGSGKAAGVKVYVNGVPAAASMSSATSLKSTIKTTGARSRSASGTRPTASKDLALQDCGSTAGR